jgi:hypothetical protein
LNDYWKGLVVGMKAMPSRVDALVQVRWYWSKNDIEASIKGMMVDPNLRKWAPFHSMPALHLKSGRILEVCNEIELFPGKELVINSTDVIECKITLFLSGSSWFILLAGEVDIVALGNSEYQDPVVEYFFRLGWDEQLHTVHVGA